MSDHAQWDNVAREMRESLGDRRIALGRYYSYWFDRTPRRALYHLSYYKFAAKLIGSPRQVLDVGCSEGIGTWLLAKECGFARGIDLDAEAIEVAAANWTEDQVEFACEDFLAADVCRFDALTSFDVIEHVMPENADAFLARVAASLGEDGIAVIGTPSEEGQRYASEVSRKGHVNVYDGERLIDALGTHFRHAFLFGANDEVVHTGVPPMSHYLIGVGVRPLSGG